MSNKEQFNHNIKKAKRQKEIERIKIDAELKWWREYGYYVANAHSNVDGEACGYADGDKEYEENFDDD